MAELSDRSGVPVATIKYYRRAGLLPPGSARAANQAVYDTSHLERLRLVRALREVADLPVAAIAEIVAAVDDPTLPIAEAVGAAHAALARGGEQPSEAATRRADEVIDRAGWRVTDRTPARDDLARALQAVEDLGLPAAPATLDRYVRAAELVAAEEVASTMGPAAPESRDEVVTGVVVGTVLYEQVLSALRRLAQEHHAVGNG